MLNNRRGAGFSTPRTKTCPSTPASNDRSPGTSGPQGPRLSTPRTKTCPRGPRFWIGAWWPVAVGVAIIVLESTEWFGANHTSSPLRWLFQGIFGPVSDENWDVIHHFLRKSGHFLGYGTLGLAWLRAWWMSLPRYRFLFDAELALVGTALVAAGDEWHQTYLPNRSGSGWDILLDCCGALAMQWAIYMHVRLFRPTLLHDRD